ncbi:MAG: hypothetical protein GX073_09615 [Firmicutes bacterium]|nr:hypothetical protein [Bacillota bacterium]
MTIRGKSEQETGANHHQTGQTITKDRWSKPTVWSQDQYRNPKPFLPLFLLAYREEVNKNNP